MTITIHKERLRTLLLKERVADSIAIDGFYGGANRCNAPFCNITDADLEKEAFGEAKNTGVTVTNNEPLYYIVDMRSGVGDCALLWRPEGEGYTTNIDEAGKFTKDNIRVTDLFVPVEVADACSERHVRLDMLRTAMRDLKK